MPSKLEKRRLFGADYHYSITPNDIILETLRLKSLQTFHLALTKILHNYVKICLGVRPTKKYIASLFGTERIARVVMQDQGFHKPWT